MESDDPERDKIIEDAWKMVEKIMGRPLKKPQIPDKELEVQFFIPGHVSNLVLIKNDPYHKVFTNYQNAFSKTMELGETKIVDWAAALGSTYPKCRKSK
jgi:hypothetical protein